jgi:hypothetical protein
MDPGLPRLRRQREPDLDLKLQLQSELSSLTSHCTWVKAHQDQHSWHTIQDLRDLYLSRDATCEHTSILRALIKYPQGNLEEIQQKTLQSTQEEPGGHQDRKA